MRQDRRDQVLDVVRKDIVPALQRGIGLRAMVQVERAARAGAHLDRRMRPRRAHERDDILADRSFDADEADRRLQDLMDRNNEGRLTPAEHEELEELAEWSEQISLVRAEALQVLGWPIE